MTQPDQNDQPVQTDNREREGIDPDQSDVSQNPEVSYSHQAEL